MSAPESPAETVRRGAEKMRGLAQAALRDVAENDYWNGCCPAAGNDDAYRHGVRDGLGGPAGELAAAFTPDVALLIADQWDEVADDMDNCQAYEVERIPAWAKTHAAAVKFLGEEVPHA